MKPAFSLRLALKIPPISTNFTFRLCFTEHTFWKERPKHIFFDNCATCVYMVFSRSEDLFKKGFAQKSSEFHAGKMLVWLFGQVGVRSSMRESFQIPNWTATTIGPSRWWSGKKCSRASGCKWPFQHPLEATCIHSLQLRPLVQPLAATCSQQPLAAIAGKIVKLHVDNFPVPSAGECWEFSGEIGASAGSGSLSPGQVAASSCSSGCSEQVAASGCFCQIQNTRHTHALWELRCLEKDGKQASTSSERFHSEE